jgi:hypothetical protein
MLYFDLLVEKRVEREWQKGLGILRLDERSAPEAMFKGQRLERSQLCPQHAGSVYFYTRLFSLLLPEALNSFTYHQSSGSPDSMRSIYF